MKFWPRTNLEDRGMADNVHKQTSLTRLLKELMKIQISDSISSVMETNLFPHKLFINQQHKIHDKIESLVTKT